MCAIRASGHSGQPPSGDPPFTRNPALVPLEVLRDFVAEQARLHTYRPVAAEYGLAAETVRKFAEGITKRPHRRQLELYGTKFLELHPSGYVREKRVDGSSQALPQLKMTLPPGRENAQEVLDRLFELAARHPDELPEQAAEVRRWLQKLLDAEYDAEARYDAKRGRRRSPDE